MKRSGCEKEVVMKETVMKITAVTVADLTRTEDKNIWIELK
jgi:hypothetical protein